jgi:mannan endo-1,4-beta-mannosidase
MMTVLAGVAGLVTVLYAISALGRLVPVKRRHHNWKQVSGMSAVTLLVVAFAGGIFGVTHGMIAPKSGPASSPPKPSVSGETMPIGVFAPGEWKSWSPVQRFSQDAGQPVRYALNYMGPDEPFPAQFGQLAADHGAEPVLQMMPTMSMADIAAGQDDAYLRSLARQVASYGHPVVLSFAPEANGSWYQWGWTRTAPSQYQAAWKHVMAQFAGARNVTWMDTVNVSYPGSGPMADYIVPGVMIGIDGYYGFGNQGMEFNSVFTPTLGQVRAHTKAPVMISETAIQGSRDQAAHIPGLIQGARQNHLAGVIWFNQDRGAGQHWTLTPAGAAALRQALASSR